jgi:hypothetical protein
MEKLNFKQILLRTAVCAIACDGDIDERETEALYKIEKNSPYFSSEDLSKDLEKLINKCIDDFPIFRNEVFENIEETHLSIVEELTLLEISFRIIAADEIELDSEKQFILDLRSHLKLDDLILTERFGVVDYLNKKESEFKNFEKTPEIKIQDIKKER